VDTERIPAAMVEAAALAVRDRLDDLGTAGHDSEGTLDGSLWLDGLDGAAADLARVALAAALGGCEIREDWGHRSHWDDGTKHDMWDYSRVNAEHTVGEAQSIPRSLIWRLHVTTPTEEAA